MQNADVVCMIVKAARAGIIPPALAYDVTRAAVRECVCILDGIADDSRAGLITDDERREEIKKTVAGIMRIAAAFMAHDPHAVNVQNVCRF